MRPVIPSCSQRDDKPACGRTLETIDEWMMKQRESEAQVGLIGIGLLGTALAERLIRHDVTVLGFDIDPTRRDALAAMGGVASNDVAGLLSSCKVVFLSLPTSDVARDVLEQNAALLQADLTIVDTTTGDPGEMCAIGAFLSQRGVDYIEATVAASSAQLRVGSGALLIGGDEAAVARLEPLLKLILDQSFYLGEVGSASRFKLVHNLMLGLHRAVLAEGLTFAEALGFNPATTLEILQQTPAVSGVMATKGKKMVMADFVPQARLSQHRKDVDLILSEAERAGTKTPLSEIHRAILEQAEALGLGELDNSAVIEVFRENAGEDCK